mmetsp:Transcript_53955/g.110403  ORF Transcript_53955/g.110403 Transcript_53955/m.110403 type:complete len:202 (+) Transcript_53955:6138-6743(+)
MPIFSNEDSTIMAKKGLLSPKGEGTFVNFEAMYRKLTKFAAKYLLDNFIEASERITGFNSIRRCSDDLSSESPDVVEDTLLERDGSPDIFVKIGSPDIFVAIGSPDGFMDKLLETKGFSSKELMTELEYCNPGFSSIETLFTLSAIKRHILLKLSLFSKSERAMMETSTSISWAVNSLFKTSFENQERALTSAGTTRLGVS